MSFGKLRAATTIVSTETLYFTRVLDWEMKWNSLQVQLHDLPTLVNEYKTRKQEPYSGNPAITLSDEIPRIRLVNACESTTNMLYGMAEIAAQFGGRVSDGILPRSFNKLCKNATEGKLSVDLVTALGDLQWYLKVRELRTEWVHYSSAFIGEEKDEPIIVVRAYRSRGDQTHIKQDANIAVADIISWTNSAIRTIDQFATYLLDKYVIPLFDLSKPVRVSKLDANGWPIILPGNRFDTEEVTVGEHLKRIGVVA